MTARPHPRVVYVATGRHHVMEAAESMKSLWQHNAGMPVTIYVDPETRVSLSELGVPLKPDGALEILDLPEATYSWGDKPLALSHLAHEHVLFLDTDTRVCGSIGDVFELLTEFDLAAAHAPIRSDPRQPQSIAHRVPASFPELNTGVVAFKVTPRVADFLRRWKQLHLDIVELGENLAVGDQVAFRLALFDSGLRFSVLTPEYNCRFTFPTYVHDPVRILHGRWPDLERIETALNRASGPRVYIPGLGTFRTSSSLVRLQLKYYSWRRHFPMNIRDRIMGLPKRRSEGNRVTARQSRGRKVR